MSICNDETGPEFITKNTLELVEKTKHMSTEEPLDLPPKGVEVLAYDSDGSKHYVFRCNCSNQSCTEWRDLIGGGALMINIVRWEYLDN